MFSMPKMQRKRMDINYRSEMVFVRASKWIHHANRLDLLTRLFFNRSIGALEQGSMNGFYSSVNSQQAGGVGISK
jgi:hypothetical protein